MTDRAGESGGAGGIGDARVVEDLLYVYAERIDAGDLPGVAELFRHGRIEAAPGVVFEVREMLVGLTGDLSHHLRFEL